MYIAHDGPAERANADIVRDGPKLILRSDIESKFLEFARARIVGDDRAAAAKAGRFSAMLGQPAPDLFGSLDMLYAAHILGRLDELTDNTGRLAWIDHILSYQADDGWFRPFDKQSHGVEHATAYALGGLQILTGGDGDPLSGKLKTFRGFQSEIDPQAGEARPPFSLPLLDRLHFWRGSHRVAGLAAIVGAVRDLGLTAGDLLGISDPDDWLQGWWSYFAMRIEPSTGYWALAPGGLRLAFDTLYQFRHKPRLAAMGGAVHLYWISEKIASPMPHPAALIATTIGLMQSSGLYEHEPYCIDLDANFLIARARPYLDPGDACHAASCRALQTNRSAVLEWFASRSHQEWNPNSHKLPGAFAAVAEADRALLPPGEQPWRDIFETTWWL